LAAVAAECDIEDLHCDPFAKMPRGHWALDDRRDHAIDDVALAVSLAICPTLSSSAT
jgi:hypothetical protein